MMKEFQINIQGLTAEDVKICDLLWNSPAPNPEAVIRLLPPEYQQRAQCLQQLIMAEVIDRYTEEDTDYAAAQDVLSRYC
jgi:hypothetical protein